MFRVLSAWQSYPSVIIGCFVLLVLYLVSHRQDLSRLYFWVAGVGVIALALLSPLDPLGDDYLFSAHMVQHMLLMLLAPPLLLSALREGPWRRLSQWPIVSRLEKLLRNPATAWVIGMVTLWVWHWPPLYNAALANEWIHIGEHLCFLIAFTIFFYPVYAPVPEARLAPLAALVYLFAGAVSNTLLGLLLTFLPVGFYPAYASPDDDLGLLTLIRHDWGITPQLDQQLGGLVMWVGGGFLLLAMMVGMLARWYRTPEPPEVASQQPCSVAEAKRSTAGRDLRMNGEVGYA